MCSASNVQRCALPAMCSDVLCQQYAAMCSASNMQWCALLAICSDVLCQQYAAMCSASNMQRCALYPLSAICSDVQCILCQQYAVMYSVSSASNTQWCTVYPLPVMWCWLTGHYGRTVRSPPWAYNASADSALQAEQEPVPPPLFPKSRRRLRISLAPK